jgi:aspartate racemase
MKMIGLIGGMSWESTATYYRLINQRIAARLGGLHSARCVVWSFDFDEIQALQRLGDWASATARMIDAGEALKRAGADLLVICTNTMHKMADELQAAVDLPLIHIADATAQRIRAAGLTHVGLLGTRFTMEQDFYRGRLMERYGLEVSIPREADRQIVHDVIFDELCQGDRHEASRREYCRIMRELADNGCQGVILGCTEIDLLVNEGDSPIPLFATTCIHAEAAADYALRA